MTVTRGIGAVCGKIIDRIVRALALSRIHPNVLTFLGLMINSWAAFLLAAGRFQAAALAVIGAGLFDLVDGRVARGTNRLEDAQLGKGVHLARRRSTLPK